MSKIKRPFLLGIDQGSSGSRALILDDQGTVCGYGYRPVKRSYPKPGWVEQDPELIASSVSEVIAIALQQARIKPDEIAAAGLTCQRNTEFVWAKESRAALGNGISWQDLRTVPLVKQVNSWKTTAEYRARLGFFPGPYSSALHLAWRMQNDEVFSSRARKGELEIGFSAEWLLARLGYLNCHHMDSSLVQAMGLYDVEAKDYWQEWLDFLDIPRQILPRATSTIHEFGTLSIEGVDVPVLAMIGDQQAALFGFDCHQPGQAECTHGTASFVNIFLGNKRPTQQHINVYLAWDMPQTGSTYCLEADTAVTGAALKWMKDHANFINDENEIDSLAASVSSSEGVVFIPAFTGLNVPHHDRQARGTILGMTLGTTRAHIVRAFLEALGFQIKDILDTVHRDTNIQVEQLHVGGGVSVSNQACQIQADLTGIPIVRAEFTETTARAAALLAGLGAGIYSSIQDLPQIPGGKTVFEPAISLDERASAFEKWQNAIEISRKWGAVE